MTGVEPQTILIDGYNVIKNTPGLMAAERVSLETGREALLAQIRAKYRHTPHTVIVVFDGDGVVESTVPFQGYSRGRVVYTRYGETADDTIRRLMAIEREHGRSQVVVVSNDGEVQHSADTAGHRVARADELVRRLNEPDRYRRKQTVHREHVRRQWEDDETWERPRGGNPRRSPRRKRGQTGDPPL